MADPEESPADRMARPYQALPGEDAAAQFLRIVKDQLRPILALRISDELFHPGRTQELAQRIEQVIDERLTAVKVPIGRQLRKILINSILADISRASRERFPGG